MKPKQLKSSVEVLSKMKQPFFVWGDPGIGKSQIVQQVAGELFEKNGHQHLLDLRAVLLDPVDLMGIPSVQNGRTHWSPPSLLPQEGEGLLFFDELNRAPVMVQNACLQLVLDRKLGEYTLPEGWVVGAAGNFESETGVQRMPDALRSRFTHLKAEIDVSQWVEYGLKNDFASKVLAFIRWRPELLHKYDRMTTKRENSFPCPRTWEFTSNILKQRLDMELQHELIAGTIGVGAATEFTAFLKLYDDLPDLENIVEFPQTAPVPYTPAVCYAGASALAHVATRKNVQAILTYMNRFSEKEYVVACIHDMCTKTPELNSVGCVTDWKIEHQGILF